MSELKERLQQPGFYVIADFSSPLPNEPLALMEQILSTRPLMLQLRDKQRPPGELVPLARQLRQLTARYETLFIINDYPELALEAEADGVHLGQADVSPARARALLGDQKIIGLSTGSKEQLFSASHHSIDYVGIGPVFHTTTKANAPPPLGLEILGWAVKNIKVELVAIGGINSQNIETVLQAGINKVAVASALLSAPDPQAAAMELKSMIENFFREGERK